jgi:hypothetical protein
VDLLLHGNILDADLSERLVYRHAYFLNILKGI